MNENTNFAVMDTLSHIVLGACMGEAMLGKKLGKKAMLWGALANNLPDIDVFFTPLFHPVDALFVHRGITHSFLFCVLMTPLLAWIFFRANKNKPIPFKEWILFFFVALITHPLLDSCTVYGTAVFEPFSHYRLQFTSLFIVEPLYTIPLLIAFIALLVKKKDSPKRKFWAKFGLISSTAYLALAICNKLYIGKIFSDSMKKQNIHYIDYTTSPTPLNNILWNVVAKDTNGLWIGYYSHFDKSKDIKFTFVPRNDSLAENIFGTHVVQRLIRFSDGYYCFTKKDGELRINDLRFAFAGDFDGSTDNFVFSFGLKKNDSAPYGVEIKKNAWSASRFRGFSKLIERIKGI